MSEFQHKPGQFSLFRNDKKGNEKRPDYTGTGADLDGNPIRVSAWIKDGKAGKFMSCRFEIAEAKPKPAQKRVEVDDDEDVPF